MYKKRVSKYAGKEARIFDKVFLFVSTFIDRRTRHDRTAPVTKVHARSG